MSKIKTKDKNGQPQPQKGYEFTGWAVFNWGICYQRVFRTRKEAIEWCVDAGQTTEIDKTWDEVSKYMKVVKVKCIVL